MMMMRCYYCYYPLLSLCIIYINFSYNSFLIFLYQTYILHRPIALKAIYHEKSTKKLLEREIQALVQLNDKQNDNILRLRGVVSNTNINGKAADVLAYEIAEKGTLLENLMYCNYFDDVLARTYFRQLLNALTCIHALNIYHRDIK